MLRSSVYSILLRGITLLGKFLLILYLGRYLTPDDMGHYGLLAASINLSVYLLGLEFYAYNTREVVKRETRTAALLRDQLVLHGIVYLIVMPALGGLFLWGLLPTRLLVWFYALLVLEHLSQEAYRVLTALERPVSANVVLFLRAGAWVYVVAVLGAAVPGLRDFDVVLAGWVLGVGTSVALAGHQLLRQVDWGETAGRSVDWRWLRQGLKSSMYFFGAVLALKSIQYSDRFFIQYFHTTDLVGVYTLYSSITNAIETFVFTGLIMIILPKLISSYQRGDAEAYRTLTRRLALGAAGGGIMLALLCYLGMPLILTMLNDAAYGNFLPAYWILLVAAVFVVLSLIPHYGLYVRDLERYIFAATLLATLLNLTLNYMLVPDLGLMGAAIGTFGAAVLLLLGKTVGLWRVRRKRAVGVSPGAET